MNNRLYEVGQAFRALRKAPTFTLTAVGTLGLAIGATAAIFTLVDTVLLNPLPYPDADRLVVLKGSAQGTDLGEEFDLSAEFLVQYRQEADLLENVASYNLFTNTLRTGDRVGRVLMSSPSAALFQILGVTPQLGRLPMPEDGAQAAVISHKLWLDWFDGDPHVIGRSYSIAGAMRTVVGIMPPDFDFPTNDCLLWFPNTLGIDNSEITPGNFGLPLVARVRPGVQREELVAQLDLIASRLPDRYGGSTAYAEIIERFTPRVVPLRDELLGPVEGALWILFGANAILLGIACANVANLFLARDDGQKHATAIRRAIGASRLSLIGRRLIETTIVAMFAAVLAVGVAGLLLPAIVAQAPYTVPRLDGTHVSLNTVLFTFAIGFVAGLACGILPAVRSAGVSLGWLRDGSRGATSGRHWTRDGLVVAQAALALLLLTGSGLLLRSFISLHDVDPGYDTQDIFTFQMAPEQAQLTDGPSWARFHLALMERLRALPGVEKVGIVDNFPLNEGTATAAFSTEPTAGAPEHRLQLTFVAGDYFEAMGIAVVRGRSFIEAEQTRNPGHIIVSRSTADRLWPGDDPIGQQLTLNMFAWQDTVIGVVEDVRQSGFRDEVGPNVYFPLVAQEPDAWALSSPAYVLRTPRADSIASDVAGLIHEVAPEAPMYRVFTIEELVADSMAELSFTMIALGLSAGLAMLLGMVGLYSILSTMVAERTAELGIRMALGANPARVRQMVMWQGVRIVGVGVVIGMIGVLVSTRTLESLLFGVRAFDVVTLSVTSLLMLLVGAAATWIPAWRASSVDPAKTLADT